MKCMERVKWKFTTPQVWASLVAQLVKKSACNAGVLGSIPGFGRFPGEGEGYPLQYFDLENCMDCIIFSQWEFSMIQGTQTRFCNNLEGWDAGKH